MMEIFDDLRKINSTLLPCEALRLFVECFSESLFPEAARSTGEQTLPLKLFPTWAPTFLINLGAPYSLQFGKSFQHIKAHEDILLVRSRILTSYLPETSTLFTVQFHPGGMEAMLGVNQVGLVGHVVPLQRILPAQLLEEMRQTSGMDERVARLQQYFLEQLQTIKKSDRCLRAVRTCIDAYTTAGMRLNSTQLAAKVFIPAKTINRCFKRIIGSPPKKYFSTLRSRAALMAFIADKATFSPTSFGYYDLSHFYREIAAFTGQRMIERR
jgi:AraC-like DNA-binding protein